MPGIPDPFAPFGAWPDFDRMDRCTTFYPGAPSEPDPRLVLAELNGFAGEEHLIIQGGKFQLFIHQGDASYLCEKPLEQDLWSNWSNQPPVGQGVTVAQIDAGGGEASLFGIHTDTPCALYHPLNDEWLLYSGCRPADVATTRLAGLYNSPWTYGNILVFTRGSTPPTPDSPWTPVDIPGHTPTGPLGHICFAPGREFSGGPLLPELDWENPWLQDRTGSGGPSAAVRGGPGEPSAIWVPHPHPTQPWPNGFVRLFYRCMQPANIAPGTFLGTGTQTWRMSYIDSEDGKTGWVRRAGGAPMWDPSDKQSQIQGRVFSTAEEGTFGLPYRDTLGNMLVGPGFGFRGNLQPNMLADPEANGVHMIGKVGNANGAGSSMTRGMVTHYFSGGDPAQGGWGEIWYESLQQDPLAGRTSVVLWPGKFPVQGIGPGDYMRTPSIVIDDSHPHVPGGSGRRLLASVNGGTNPTKTGRPNWSFIASAAYPDVSPSTPPVSLGSGRIVNFTNDQREGICYHRIPLPNENLWDGGEPTITVTDAEQSPGDQRCQIYEKGPNYLNTSNPMYVRVAFKAYVAAGISDPDFGGSYTWFKEKLVTFSTATTAGAAWAKHPEVDLDNTTFEVAIPYPGGGELLTFQLGDEIEDEYPLSNEDTTQGIGFSATQTATAQSFTGLGGTLTRIRTKLGVIGSPTGNVLCTIRAHSGTYGTSSVPTGAALATSAPIDSATIASGATTQHDFEFPTGTVLANGTNYCAVFEFVTGDASNYVRVGADTSSPTHGGNAATFDDPTWTASPTGDLVFQAFSEKAERYQNERTVGNEVAKHYRHFEVTTPGSDYPIFYGKLILWVPSGQRACHFWLHIGNGIAGDDATASLRPRTFWSVPSEVTLTVDNGPRLVIYGQDTKLPRDVENNGSEWTAALMSGVDTVGRTIRGGLELPDGYGHGYFGRLIYEGGSPTTLESDSISAEQASMLEAMSLEWPEKQTFGPTQIVVKRPENSFISSELEGRVQWAKYMARDLAQYADATHTGFRPIHGCHENTGNTGSQPDFGVSKGWQWARSGLPDFRSLRLSVFQETLRWHNWYEPDGSIVRINTRTGQSGLYSDLYFWNGRPFYGNQAYSPSPGVIFQTLPTFSDGMGRGGQFDPFRDPFPGAFVTNATRIELCPIGDPGRQCRTTQSGHWTGYDNEHHAGNFLAAFALMTGDPLAEELVEHNTQSALAQNFAFYDDRESPTGGGTAQLTGILQGRAQGRLMITLAGNYYVNGDPWIPAVLQARAANVYDVPEQFPGGSRNNRISWRGRGRPRTDVRIMSTDAEATLGISPGATSAFSSWQQSFVAYGHWCCFLMTGNAIMAEIASEIAYAITNYCVRRGAPTNFAWEQPVAAQYQPYGNPAEPVREADWFALSMLPDPFTGFKPYMVRPAGVSTWARGSYVLGYLVAEIEGDSAWKERCGELQRDIIGLEDEFSAAGPLGWGPTDYENGDYDWTAFEEDPFRLRVTGGGSVLGAVDATLAGLSFAGDGVVVAAPPTAVTGDVDATFAGLLFNGAGNVSTTVSVIGSMDATFRGLSFIGGGQTFASTITGDVDARFEGLNFAGRGLTYTEGGSPSTWVGR